MPVFGRLLACCGRVPPSCTILLILIQLNLVLSILTDSDGGTNGQASNAAQNLSASSPPDRFSFCTSDPDWTASTRAPWDCASTLKAFEESYFLRQFGKQPVEFYAADARPREPHHYFSIPTPIKFSTKKCTIAIAMLRAFPEKGDPKYENFGLPGGFDYFRDTSVILSFEDIYQAALVMVPQCTRQHWGHQGSGGWKPVGVADSLGIFAWRTGSNIDNFIERARYRPSGNSALDASFLIGTPFSNPSNTSVATS